MGQDGANWMVHLTNENKCRRMRLGRGRNGFCEAHGVKIGESPLCWNSCERKIQVMCLSSAPNNCV